MLDAAFQERVSRSLEEVSRLRRFSGTPPEFWPAFVSAAAGIAGAEKGILILKDPKDNGWKKLSEWSQAGHADRTTLTFNRHLIQIGEAAGPTAHRCRPSSKPQRLTCIISHWG